MKISLVVASGVHQGKVIPVAGAQFLIGRDPECQLRPASQAVSKQHCAILVRAGKVYLKDFGSTNGTFVNDEQLPPESEREVVPKDRIKLGPLDFLIEFTPGQPSDSTPLPDALKSVSPAGGSKSDLPATRKMTMPAPTPPQKVPPAPSAADDNDAAAAMLLGMGDEDDPKVPGGSTIMEMTSVNADGTPAEKKDEPKKGAVPSREDTSNAASDILRRYMRRPR